MEELFPAGFLKRLESLPLRLARAAGRGGTGGAASAWGGESDEFLGHAPYTVGDDLRRVDWPAYGRTGKLVLRTFRPGREDAVGLACDTSASMRVGDGGKLLFALRLSAAIGHVALSGGQSLLLSAGAVKLELPPGSRLPALLDALRRAFASHPVAFPGNQRHPTATRAARFVAITDGMDEPAAIQRAYSGFRRTSWVAVFAPDELSPTLNGRFNMVGAEGGAPLDIEIGQPELAAYGRELARHEQSWQTAATAARAKLLRAVSHEDPIEFLMDSRARMEVHAGPLGGRP